MKQIITTIVILAAAATTALAAAHTRTAPDDAHVIIIDGRATAEELLNRDGEILIERVKGTVLNANGDGMDDEGGYIAYPTDIPAGTRVESYLIYNPDTDYVDDIIERYDYIITAE